MLRYYYQHYAEKYLGVFTSYNEAILRHITSISRNDFLVLDYNLLSAESAYILEVLTKNWGFDLHHADFNGIYKQELISTTVEMNGFIKDRALIAKAENIEKQLQQYAFVKNDGINIPG